MLTTALQGVEIQVVEVYPQCRFFAEVLLSCESCDGVDLADMKLCPCSRLKEGQSCNDMDEVLTDLSKGEVSKVKVSPRD